MWLSPPAPADSVVASWAAQLFSRGQSLCQRQEQGRELQAGSLCALAGRAGGEQGTAQPGKKAGVKRRFLTSGSKFLVLGAVFPLSCFGEDKPGQYF